MSAKTVLGIGNALTDVLVEATDAMLAEFDLPKGSMQLVDAKRSAQLMERLGKSCTERRCAGGCASNTITGLGELGVKTAFIGKVGRDEVGAFFEQDLHSHGVESKLLKSDTPSGIALALITPDGERTFATHLGAAVELTDDDLSPGMFEGADTFHIEGYLVQNQALIAGAIKKAKRAGCTVSIDLAAYNVVAENLDFLQGILDTGLDVVFCNEDEAREFTGKEEEQALEQLAGRCEVAVVKLGERGSLVARGKQRVHVPVETISAIDTTGAGDLYATGFLYGLVNDRSLEDCARIGSIVAREVIQIMGTKLEPFAWSQIRTAIEALD
jgi:sugar/nucleoside kinase (ribokinase family)